MIEKLILPARVHARIVEASRLAYPSECCGLIEGVREEASVRAIAAHATRNIAEGDDRFEIDPAEHIAILVSLRHGGTEIVGCYHSHPNGKCEPSARDMEAAFGDNFLWLIGALGSDGRDVTLRAFELRATGQREVPIIEPTE